KVLLRWQYLTRALQRAVKVECRLVAVRRIARFTRVHMSRTVEAWIDGVNQRLRVGACGVAAAKTHVEAARARPALHLQNIDAGRPRDRVESRRETGLCRGRPRAVDPLHLMGARGPREPGTQFRALRFWRRGLYGLLPGHVR